MNSERRKFNELLEGKGNAMLKEKITVLESAIKEHQSKDKEVKTKERMHNKKVDELSRELRDTKLEMDKAVDSQKRGFQERID